MGHLGKSMCHVNKLYYMLARVHMERRGGAFRHMRKQTHFSIPPSFPSILVKTCTSICIHCMYYVFGQAEAGPLSPIYNRLDFSRCMSVCMYVCMYGLCSPSDRIA